MLYAASIVIGLIIGSFITALQNRLDDVWSIVYGRSKCPHCGHTLGVLDLIPVLGFVFLRGRCRYCGKKIGLHYPMIELLVAVIAVYVNYYFGFSYQSLLLFLSVCILVIACVSDIKNREVEVWLFVSGIFFAVLWRFCVYLDVFTLYDVLLGAFSAAFLPLILSVLSREKWMGYGDSFFAVWAGTLCGFPLGLVGIFLSFLFGSIFGIIILLRKRKSGKILNTKMPFGPFIFFGTLVTLVCGSVILDAYLGLFGY